MKNWSIEKRVMDNILRKMHKQWRKHFDTQEDYMKWQRKNFAKFLNMD